MERLFTCFVSSTFTDLRSERQRLVSVLLSNECVPIGMEFFPSAGKTQWPIIVEAMESADFCIFVSAGRYGSISDNPPESWTHREFREARRLGKPIAAVLHASPGDLPAKHCEPDASGREALAAFRHELEGATVCRYYSNEADLVEAVSSSIRYFRENERLQGWIRAAERPVLASEADFGRTYELLDISWELRSTGGDGEALDCSYRARRRVISNDPVGLGHIAIDFTKANDRHPLFSDSRYPQLKIESFDRSDGGSVRLEEPRKRKGAEFVQDASLRPPLGLGEVADFVVTGFLPAYKFRYRDQILEATDDGRGTPRTYEWASRRIAYPTRRLRMSVFIPDSLGIEPLGPLVGLGASSTDTFLSRELELSDAYTLAAVTRQGEAGIEMALDIPDPLLRRRYRLAWELPRRSRTTGT